MRVDPVPLVREAAFDRVGICVSPCGSPADGFVILWFEEVGEECGGTGREEGLGHEADLVMDWRVVSRGLCMGGWARVPSVFQHRAGPSHAAVYRSLCVSSILHA